MIIPFKILIFQHLHWVYGIQFAFVNVWKIDQHSIWTPREHLLARRLSTNGCHWFSFWEEGKFCYSNVTMVEGCKSLLEPELPQQWVTPPPPPQLPRSNSPYQTHFCSNRSIFKANKKFKADQYYKPNQYPQCQICQYNVNSFNPYDYFSIWSIISV